MSLCQCNSATLFLMPTIKNLPIHLRPREKLLDRGASTLTTAELLAILIRVGRAGHSALSIAESIVKKFPDLSKITQGDLKQIKGIDIAKIASILAALELSRRVGDQPAGLVKSPTDAVPYLANIRASTREHFVALYLSARHELVHQETISIGTLTSSLVHPREVYKHALIHPTASILVAHNHPSGDTTPSEEDLMITRRLVDAGNLLGISLLDHVIVTRNSYYSLREHNQLT